MLVSPSGARTALPAGAVVTWSGAPLVTALPSGTDPTDSNLPATGSAPTALFLSNASHYTEDQLAGALFVIDAGTASRLNERPMAMSCASPLSR